MKEEKKFKGNLAVLTSAIIESTIAIVMITVCLVVSFKYRYSPDISIPVFGVILVYVSRVFIIWIANNKYSGIHGKGWAIFLLIYGIFTSLFSITLLGGGDYGQGLGYLISGFFMIFSFTNKIKTTKK